MAHCRLTLTEPHGPWVLSPTHTLVPRGRDILALCCSRGEIIDHITVIFPHLF
jgi:hypothetical protein